MADLFAPYWATLSDSQIFMGGLALGILGILASFALNIWRVLRRVAERRLASSVTIDNRSEAYRHALLWLKNSAALNHVRQLYFKEQLTESGETALTPAPGQHWFWHEGRLCSFNWNVSEKQRVSGRHGQDPMETLTITTYLSSPKRIEEWLAQGREIARTQERIGPGLHVLRGGDYWDYVGDVQRRGLETIVVDDDRLERVVADMRRFYDAADWYAQRGVPWRRGYLFYGPPGTGKSSLARALASELDRDLATLDLARPGMSDDDLREAMLGAPKNAILVIEDIDAIFVQREASGQRSGVSFSGLLNAIDGVGAQEGRALVMTTNHRERLDPALIRPGRADLHVEMGYVGAQAAGALFERFFPEHPALTAQFRAVLGNTRIAPCELQGWLLENADNPVAAANPTRLTLPRAA